MEGVPEVCRRCSEGMREVSLRCDGDALARSELLLPSLIETCTPLLEWLTSFNVRLTGLST